MQKPLDKAIAIAKWQTALAEAVSVHCKTPLKPINQRHVWSWKKRGGKIPAEYCAAFELATGIPKAQFRPDVFGDA